MNNKFCEKDYMQKDQQNRSECPFVPRTEQRDT